MIFDLPWAGFAIWLALAFVAGLIADRLMRWRGAEKIRRRLDRGDEAFFQGVQHILSNEPDQAIEQFTKSVQINSDTAAKKGIKTGDSVVITSPWGEIDAKAFCRQGVRPDCLVVTQYFGHWKTPYAKDKDWPNMNELEPGNVEMTDATGSSSDQIKVKISKKR